MFIRPRLSLPAYDEDQVPLTQCSTSGNAEDAHHDSFGNDSNIAEKTEDHIDRELF